ncbi:MAG: hypothetical protein LUH05_04670, partial [Candidatus Gastranaerophilales bacterium]|nr:hypothetical protein [Candidatus Gastranaerophilales bacterium]
IILIINIIGAFCIKNKKIITAFNGLFLVFFSCSFPYYYEIYLYSLYRFVPIFILVIFTIIILWERNNELKEYCSRLIPFLVVTLLISNIYIITFSYQYKEFNNQLVKSSGEGFFYIEDDIENFARTKMFRNPFIVSPYDTTNEMFAYSIIAINSQKRKANTKGIITAFRPNLISICKENNEKIHAEGQSLSISIKNKFWDLSPYNSIYNEFCN